MYRLKDFPPMSDEARKWMEGYSPSPIFETLGIRVKHVEAGLSNLEMEIRKEHTHNGGIAQGGVICTIADSAIAYAVRSALSPEFGQTSIDLKINFIRPVSSGLITAEGWLIHLGAKTAVGESIVLTEAGKVVAKALSTVAVLPRRRTPQEV